MVGLDVLRALAVLAVIGHHMAPCPREVSSFFCAVSESFVRGGWIGVDLFFVLSGFLVSGLLFGEHRATGQVQAGRFLIRRGFKIYPAFWMLLLVTLAVKIARHQPIEGGQWMRELLFVQNYGEGLWMHTWSLAVEEHFYLLLTLLIWTLARRSKEQTAFRLIPAAFVFVLVVSTFLRWFEAEAIAKNHKIYFQSHFRLDALFCGVLIAYWRHYHPGTFRSLVRQWWPILMAIGAGLLLRHFLPANGWKQWGATLFGLIPAYMGAALVLLATLGLETKPGSPTLGMAYLGSHSYSIYLWHMPVLTWVCATVQRLFPASWNYWAYLATSLLGATIVGIGMAALVEFPVLRLRDRWFPAERRRASADEALAEKASPLSVESTVVAG